MKVYIIGSLKNIQKVVHVDIALKEAGFEPFSEWASPGPDADDYWQEYTHAKGLTFREASHSPHAENVFDFDYKHLMDSDAVVVVLPAGKSAFSEMAWFGGYWYARSFEHCEAFPPRPCFILMTEPPERFDVMWPRFAYMTGGDVVESVEELIEGLKKFVPLSVRGY